jgi:hypothetical protein
MGIIKEDEMGGACSTHRRDEKCVQNPKGREHSEDIGIDGRIVLEWILGKRVGKCGLDASGSG